MIRLAARALKHLGLTIALLVGGLCALEVSLRGYRVMSGGDEIAGGRADINGLVVVPSRATYVSVAPRLKIEQAAKGGPVLLRTNSFGLRNAEIDVPRDPDLFRILCLGDETTLATDLPESATYCRQLAEILEHETSTKVEVLNGGCPGGCPTIAALLERHRFLGLQADVILLHIDPSDPADEEMLRRHVERSAAGFPIAAIHPGLAGATGTASHLDDEFLIVRFLRDEVRGLWQQGHSGLTPDDSRGSGSHALEGPYHEIDQAIRALQELARSQGTELIVTTTKLPNAVGKSRKSSAADDQWPPRELLAACDDTCGRLIDASDEVAAAEEESSRPASRLSPQGHAAYAAVLADEVLRRFTEEDTAQAPDSRRQRQ